MSSHAAARPSRRSFVSAFALLLALTALPVIAATKAEAVSSNIVISQVYGGGGNTSAPYQRDFIELFNLGTSSQSVNGWSVQYASATGTTWQVTNLPNVTLAVGQYLLVAEAQGTSCSGSPCGVALPTPDTTGTIPMSGTAGKVALVNSTTAITTGTSCPSSGIIDFVGYGTTANCFEGTGPTPAPSNTNSVSRGASGCTDTDVNSSDFTAGSPNPRNTSTTTSPCTADQAPSVSSTTPANGATGVPLDYNITVTFSESVAAASGWFDISCANSGTHTAVESGGPTTYTLNPDSDFTASELCTVTIDDADVTDTDTNDPPDTMSADHVFSFTTLGSITPIHDIQEATHLSSDDGTSKSIRGIVTSERSNGFWVQEEDGDVDADPSTSEGIFVFTSSSPTVNPGDDATVTGTVDEFRPGGGGSTGLTITELTSPSVFVNSTGNTLPTATAWSPPTMVIEDDAGGNVETGGVFDPASDGIDYFESLEGMRVSVNDPVSTGPTNGFGEISVLANDGAGAGVRTTRGGIVVRANDFNPERIILDDVVGDTPNVHTGAHLSDITGVLDYSFGNFKLYPDVMPTVLDDLLARETTPLGPAPQLSVATFNVENLDPSDGTKFDDLADLLVNNLRSPDLVTLEEVQDNNGATNDATVSADTTLNMLVTAITNAGGPTYEYRYINPVDDQDGGEPGGNIRVAFLFRTDEGLTFVDRAGGGPTTATTVSAGAGGPELSASPGRIDPTNSAFNSSRKPLVGEFMFDGHPLFVIANHWNSKGGDDPLFGWEQPPTLSSETQRNQQAAIVNDFVDDILAVDPSANIVVAGDFNDFEFSTPIATLTDNGTVLNPLILELPQAERYSYVFDGNSQTLDHIFVSDNLMSSLALYDSVHVNAEFHDQVSDHDPALARFKRTPRGCTITGTTGDDTLNGTAGPDKICGLEGDDTINGLGGDDWIVGAQGADDISGGDGNDLLVGGGGADQLNGGAGSDVLNGAGGNDVLNAGDSYGFDSGSGGSGFDTCVTDPGDSLAGCEA